MIQLKKYLLSFVLLLMVFVTVAQSVTKVSGYVYDKQTKLPIPFAELRFINTNVGATTDDNGFFNIETRFPSDTLICQYLGYKDIKYYIKRGDKTSLRINMDNLTLKLETVEIVTKKGKYSKKNNPAIDLAKLITSNKRRNQLKGLPYYKYDKYEKIRFDLNNITEGFKKTPLLRDFDFLWNYIDTSTLNGRTYLPVFIREVISTNHFRKDPEVEKERRHAIKYTKLTDQFDIKSMNNALDLLYEEIDIYEDQINLLEKQFVSPLASVGPNFYRYYIIDTTVVNGKSAINLAFIPAVKGNFGFMGNIFVSNDSRYTVLKIDMGIIQDININFVRDMRIIQEFEPIDTNYIKIKDELIIDYALSDNGLGAYGNKTTHYTNFDFTEPKDKSVFNGIDKILDDENIIKSEEYWQQNRIEPLSKTDAGLYTMIDSLRNNKRYKTYVYLGRVVTSGYTPIGPIEFGPIATFVSFNDVEGVQYRFGGGTTVDFHKKLRIQAYGSYVNKAKLWKYSSGITWSFNENYRDNPKHYVRLFGERASYFPGQDLAFFSPENLLLSFRRGRTTNMILNDHYEANYVKEGNGYAFEGALIYRNRLPFGTLDYKYTNSDGVVMSLPEITTGEVYIGLKYAPNERYIQNKDKRVIIPTVFPVLRLNYYAGLKGFLGGDYNYHRVSINMLKQWEFTTLGTTNMILEAGKSFGNIPYILRFIPRGNQTFAYQLPSYNMMNFLEFSAEQYASVNFDHYFFGYFLNRIPLIKKIKLREVVGFKMIYGHLASRNNPDLNPDQIQFPVVDGQKTTFTFDKRPYIEVSVGLTNIFKLFRVDLVRRLTYLDDKYPNLPTLFGVRGMGIRAAVKVEF
jgi:hypothetical protein